MPAPIISGVIQYITTNINVVVWDAEVPRYDTSGHPINPDSSVLPSNWPVIQVTMSDSGFQRSWTFTDPYSDEGEITIKVWDVSRSGVESLLSSLEVLFASTSGWANIPLTGGPSLNPYYVIEMLLTSWCSVQEDSPARTSKSEFIYRGELRYNCMIHGAVATT